MKRLVSLVSLALLFAACTPSTPTELVPTFDSLIGLPGLMPSDGCTTDDCCLEAGWCLDVETLSLRNVGDGTITISSVAFTSDSDPAFKDLESSAMTLGPDEQANLRFRYTSPNGAAQQATLVIESDAAVNPTLEVPVETAAYTPPAEEDAGPTPDAGEPDSGVVVDAGPEEVDAGSEIDAGADAPDAGEDGDVDAGGDDAGDAG